MKLVCACVSVSVYCGQAVAQEHADDSFSHEREAEQKWIKASQAMLVISMGLWISTHKYQSLWDHHWAFTLGLKVYLGISRAVLQK